MCISNKNNSNLCLVSEATKVLKFIHMTADRENKINAFISS